MLSMIRIRVFDLEMKLEKQFPKQATADKNISAKGEEGSISSSNLLRGESFSIFIIELT